jgi:hypothetical protein
MSYIGNTFTTQAFTPAVDFFNGNGSTTAFTLSRPVASVAQVQAVISNVPQKPGDAFTVSGNTITFTSAPPSGTQNIYVYYTSPITQVIAPGQNTVGTAQIQNGSVIPADLSTGGLYWDTSGNVGLNTTSPTARLTIGLQSYTASATSGMIRFKNDQNSADGCIQSYSVASNIGTDIVFGSNFYVDTAGQFQRFNTSRESSFQIISRTGTVYWGTGGTGATATQALTLNQSGVLALKGGNDSANGVGIAFPATQSASSNANTLDDYEEGTWTPAINYGGTVATLSVAFGFYVKVGRHVTLTGYLTTTNKNGGTGDAVLSGLPFPIGNSSNHYPGGSLGYYANLTLPAGTTGLAWYGIVNSGSIYLGYNSTTNWAQLNGSLAGNNAQYGPFTICYISD